MSLIVMKFGGTSVGDAARIRASALIVQRAAGKNQVAVVVSALSGVTDLILKTVSAARQGEGKQVSQQMQLLQDRHKNVIGELFKGADRKGIEEQVGSVLKQLHDICGALLILRSTTAQIMDAAAPMGEKMSAYIFSGVLRTMGAAGEFVDSTRVLITDDRFGDASADMEATGKKLTSF